MKKILKKVLALSLCACMMTGMATGASASAKDQTANISNYQITRNEYVESYAIHYGLTIKEAAQMVKNDDERILLQYCKEKNIILPRSIVYTDGFPSAGGATIWYVRVEGTYRDSVTSINYGANGRVLQDAHSKTFVSGSFFGFAIPGNGNYTVEGQSISVDIENYTTVRIGLTGYSQIVSSTATTYGLGSALISASYSLTDSLYWRKSIFANYRQTV